MTSVHKHCLALVHHLHTLHYMDLKNKKEFNVYSFLFLGKEIFQIYIHCSCRNIHTCSTHHLGLVKVMRRRRQPWGPVLPNLNYLKGKKNTNYTIRSHLKRSLPVISTRIPALLNPQPWRDWRCWLISDNGGSGYNAKITGFHQHLRSKTFLRLTHRLLVRTLRINLTRPVREGKKIYLWGDDFCNDTFI